LLPLTDNVDAALRLHKTCHSLQAHSLQQLGDDCAAPALVNRCYWQGRSGDCHLISINAVPKLR
jgi:hypothetical protein